MNIHSRVISLFFLFAIWLPSVRCRCNSKKEFKYAKKYIETHTEIPPKKLHR